MLQDIEWSSDKVLKQTLTHAKRLQLDVAPMDTLMTLHDIDTVQVGPKPALMFTHKSDLLPLKLYSNNAVQPARSICDFAWQHWDQSTEMTHADSVSGGHIDHSISCTECRISRSGVLNQDLTIPSTTLLMRY